MWLAVNIFKPLDKLSLTDHPHHQICYTHHAKLVEYTLYIFIFFRLIALTLTSSWSSPESPCTKISWDSSQVCQDYGRKKRDCVEAFSAVAFRGLPFSFILFYHQLSFAILQFDFCIIFPIIDLNISDEKDDRLRFLDIVLGSSRSRQSRVYLDLDLGALYCVLYEILLVCVKNRF